MALQQVQSVASPSGFWAQYFLATQWHGKGGGDVLMWKKCKRDLSHIIVTLHSVSKKPMVRKSFLGI